MSEGEQAYRAGWITLTADHELWKHVKWPHLRRDGTVNSSAYLLNGQPDPSISVDIAEMTTFQDVRKRRGPSIGVGILMAGYPLNAMQLTLRHEPTVGPPAGDNDAHAVIETIYEIVQAKQLAAVTDCILFPDEPLP